MVDMLDGSGPRIRSLLLCLDTQLFAVRPATRLFSCSVSQSALTLEKARERVMFLRPDWDAGLAA